MTDLRYSPGDVLVFKDEKSSYFSFDADPEFDWNSDGWPFVDRVNKKEEVLSVSDVGCSYLVLACRSSQNTRFKLDPGVFVYLLCAKNNRPYWFYIPDKADSFDRLTCLCSEQET